jgi:hypothetical protein
VTEKPLKIDLEQQKKLTDYQLSEMKLFLIDLREVLGQSKARNT